MQLAEFRLLIDRLLAEIPPAYRRGVVAVDVSAKALPHPVHADVYTLGECIPLEWSGDGSDLQSRVVLYHGSFRALSRLRGEFDWREEAWETLTHELRHHLEWQARVGALEDYDWAAEQNFARHEGQRFDPVFYRSGERLEDGVYKVDDDLFLEQAGVDVSSEALLVWHGRRYRVPLPAGVRTPAFVTLEGLAEPPPGEAVLVLPRRVRLFNFWRRVRVLEVTVSVEPADG